jgi:hypothetical protein
MHSHQTIKLGLLSHGYQRPHLSLMVIISSICYLVLEANIQSRLNKSQVRADLRRNVKAKAPLIG